MATASGICGKRSKHPDELPSSSQGILRRFFSGQLEHLASQVESIGKRLAEIDTAAASSALKQEIKRCHLSIDQLLTELTDFTEQVEKDNEERDKKIDDLAERVAQLEIQVHSQSSSSRSENGATPCSTAPMPFQFLPSYNLGPAAHQALPFQLALLQYPQQDPRPTFVQVLPSPVESLAAIVPPQNPPPSDEETQTRSK